MAAVGLGAGLCAASIVACDGGDGEGPDGDAAACGLGGSLSGAVTAEFSIDTELACGYGVSSSPGFYATYVVTGGALESVTITVSDVGKGEVGGGFAASVELNGDAGMRWAAACTAVVDVHELDPEVMIEGQDIYQARGTISCAEPATGEGLDPVEIGELAYATPVGWRQ